jgi:hypothetical protein
VRQITTCLLIVRVFVHCSSAGASAEASNEADTAALVRLASDAGHAYAARDLATLEEITAWRKSFGTVPARKVSSSPQPSGFARQFTSRSWLP